MTSMATSPSAASLASSAKAPGYLHQVEAILWKDLVIEARSKDAILSILVFGIVALTVFVFSFELRADTTALVAPGVLWVAILFAGTLGLGRTFSAERERGSLEGLLLCPVDRSAIYVAKLLVNLFFIGLAELILVPTFGAFFDVHVLNAGLLLVILLGTVGFAAVGTVFAAMAVNTRAREVLLPILLLPVLVPLIIASVKASAIHVLRHKSGEGNGNR